MVVKINGSVIDMARVMRFAPHKKDGLDFRPEDVCTLAELEQRCEKMAKLPSTHQFKTVDRMGWRFVLLKDIYGNTFRSALHRSAVSWNTCRNEKSR